MNPDSALKARRMSESEMLALINQRAANGGAANRRIGILSLLALWWHRFVERNQMRRDLDTFTDEVLADFGMTWQEALAETKKPFWRA
ncbi:protein of unknown function [Cohaesibacter sp. ES.047]|uniref:DUF1127 domain-containing protein n=1 Tax=Cohaesibacter sp. ES.047 TaxID=1798205 RepID=UPI000BBF7FA9|nr:DUF1127 domain-containing protein [Cohaesibacter sp. ES.047]SNY92461.1 protein of unknown function [Cohaesibacter sp. ES.047]